MLKERVRKVVAPVSTAAMLALPTMSAYAAESTGIDLSAITTSAMNQITSDMKIVIAAFVAGAVGLVSISVGVSYLLKKAKALKSAA